MGGAGPTPLTKAPTQQDQTWPSLCLVLLAVPAPGPHRGLGTRPTQGVWSLHRAQDAGSWGLPLSHGLPAASPCTARPAPQLLQLRPHRICDFPFSLSLAPLTLLPVLSIHKLPASGATDISFPMKGWRATGDWAKVPEDRVTVSKSVFSTGLAGEGLREPGDLHGERGPQRRVVTTPLESSCYLRVGQFSRGSPFPGSPPCPLWGQGLWINPEAQAEGSG